MSSLFKTITSSPNDLLNTDSFPQLCRMALQLQQIEALGEYFTHYYLCNYRPRSVGSDQLSESLIRFKECKRVDVEAWTECSILELSKVRFSEDLQIIRALGLEEMNATTTSRTAMDWLGHRMEKEGK